MARHMTDFPFDIVGFDLDGTLVDTSGDLAAAVNHALATAGRTPLEPDEVRPMIGGGAKLMLERGLAATGGCDPDESRRLYKLMLAFYADNIAVHSRPYPGAVAAVDALRAAGVKTAIITNKFESLARTLMDALALTDRFDLIIGGDTLGKGNAKPSPAPLRAMIERLGGGRAAFVGDSHFDIDAARAAGIPGIAVSFGFSDRPVTDLGADGVIDSYAALIPALAGLSTI